MTENFSSTSMLMQSYMYNSAEHERSSMTQREQPSTTTDEKRIKKTESFPFGKCRICNDTATGVHYGVITCEGCKGFFKRAITKGISHRCLFGDGCIVSVGTRNRCKSCRFNRCIQQGMSMDSVKMGRIPKKVKERALRYYRQFEERSKVLRNKDNNALDTWISFDWDSNSSYQLPRSISSSSSSSSFNANTQQGNDQDLETPADSFGEVAKLLNESLESADLHKLSLSLYHGTNHNLSLLRLPEILSSLTLSNTWLNTLRFNDELSTIPSMDNNKMTLSKYISKINEDSIIEYDNGNPFYSFKRILPIMKYLLPKLCQPYLIYEFDFEIVSFFRYIRWQIFKTYIKHTRRVRSHTRQMFEIIKQDVSDPWTNNTTEQQMWSGVLAAVAVHMRELLGFAQDTPGLNELNPTDFMENVNNHVFDFWAILNYPLFYKRETYIITPNGLQYTRHFMSKFIGRATTDALHELSERIHSLNITQVEHSLMMSIVLCQPSAHIQDQESMHIIKHCYLYALYIQLCSSRTENEAKILFNNLIEIIESTGPLAELCKKNIGRLIVDNQASQDEV